MRDLPTSYEEDFRPCKRCGERTWHGRNAPGVFSDASLTVFSHLITVYTDVLVPWRCLTCGAKARGKSSPPGPESPGK